MTTVDFSKTSDDYAKAVQRFDAELAAELAARFPTQPMLILHRTFAVVARAPL